MSRLRGRIEGRGAPAPSTDLDHAHPVGQKIDPLRHAAMATIERRSKLGYA